MQTQFFASRPALERPLAPVGQTAARSANYKKISLHRMVNQLLAGLQPLALRRDSIILNGIPHDLTVMAEENTLAYVLGSLLDSAINSGRNECIHIVAFVAEDRTMICVKDVGTYYYHAISTEYRKIQYAAEQLGGSISVDQDDIHGTNVSFSITNRLLAA
jgi:hypothetical protein